jgi:hypothetical protein
MDGLADWIYYLGACGWWIGRKGNKSWLGEVATMSWTGVRRTGYIVASRHRVGWLFRFGGGWFEPRLGLVMSVAIRWWQITDVFLFTLLCSVSLVLTVNVDTQVVCLWVNTTRFFMVFERQQSRR